MSALTAAIEWMSRWKIDAASTASALPSATAAVMSAGVPAPPEATTGTWTREVTGRSNSMIEAFPGAVAIDRGQQHLAGTELDTAVDPLDRVDAGGLAAALDHDLPASRCHRGARAASTLMTTHWLPKRRAQVATSAGIVDGGRVDRDLVGTGAQDIAHVERRAHAAADRQGHEDLAGGAFDDVEQRAAAFGAAVMSRKQISSAPAAA